MEKARVGERVRQLLLFRSRYHVIKDLFGGLRRKTFVFWLTSFDRFFSFPRSLLNELHKFLVFTIKLQTCFEKSILNYIYELNYWYYFKSERCLNKQDRRRKKEIEGKQSAVWPNLDTHLGPLGLCLSSAIAHSLGDLHTTASSNNAPSVKAYSTRQGRKQKKTCVSPFLVVYSHEGHWFVGLFTLQ